MDYYRGSDYELNITDDGVYLVSKSYKTIKSFIGKYEEDGVTKYARVILSEPITPYSTFKIDGLDKNLTILYTAKMFDAKFKFAGLNCTETEDGTRYCYPTTSENQETGSEFTTGVNEEKAYTDMLSLYNHMYNSYDGIRMFSAWAEGRDYITRDGTILDFSEVADGPSYVESSGFTSTRDYVDYNMFMALMPNHHTYFKVIRYVSIGATGIGILPDLSIATLDNREDFGQLACIWEGMFEYSTNENAGVYRTTHHEIMHTFSFEHESGMTYGWSDAIARTVIPTLYNVEEPILAEAPKYIFETKVDTETNKLKITLYKTSDALEDSDFRVDFMNDYKMLEGDINKTQESSNSVEFDYNSNIIDRLFIRVYGADSNSLMTEFIEF
jgi:hypothetical protein